MMPRHWLHAYLTYLLIVATVIAGKKHEFGISVGGEVTVKTAMSVDTNVAVPAIPNLAMEHMDENQAFAMVGIRQPEYELSCGFARGIDCPIQYDFETGDWTQHTQLG